MFTDTTKQISFDVIDVDTEKCLGSKMNTHNTNTTTFEVKLSSYARFNQNQWLNDECINDYLEFVLKPKFEKKGKFFSSFFYTKLQDRFGNYNFVKWRYQEVY